LHPQPQLEIDVRGLRCPLPVLRLSKLVADAPAGSVVRVQATDPVAARDIPAFALERGWKVLAVETERDIVVLLQL
jgi:tRNA 2-thiouridine synthesizing protein A